MKDQLIPLIVNKMHGLVYAGLNGLLENFNLFLLLLPLWFHKDYYMWRHLCRPLHFPR